MRYEIECPKFITVSDLQLFDDFSGLCHECYFDIDLYSKEEVVSVLGETIFQELSIAVPARQVEFVAGRYLAGKVLQGLGGRFTVLEADKNRCPIWPFFYTGSISHAYGRAVCAATLISEHSSVGVDVEGVVDDVLASMLENTIMTTQDRALCNSSMLPKALMMTLIFSAKESLFKALYPHIGRHFGFEVAFVKELNVQTRCITMELLTDLNENWVRGCQVSGRFELLDKRVYTLVTL
ncbi:4'-phosphopantetheinyl transferase family protein [Vibrio jasicida]|uniref:4'-phosphopantetheinyl transferase family protein n=1 Tax=Vibrio jasicida TaxID=766224 RepID=UPI004068E5E2